MRIVQYLRAGYDCPEELCGDPKFREQIIKITRQRLELRPSDVVEVHFT